MCYNIIIRENGGVNVAKNINLKLARIKKNMTQKDLSDEIGVARQTINAIEKGEYNPSIRLCLKICWALDSKLDELFWEDQNNEEMEE